jgi:hypothetical protein
VLSTGVPFTCCSKTSLPEFSRGSGRNERPVLWGVENIEWLKVNEAALVADVSRDTILRNLKSGALPRSRRASGPSGSATGPWLIPVADLIAAGMRVNMSRLDGTVEEAGANAACGDAGMAKLAVLLLWSWSLERRHAADLEAETDRLWAVLRDRLVEQAPAVTGSRRAGRGQD